MPPGPVCPIPWPPRPFPWARAFVAAGALCLAFVVGRASAAQIDAAAVDAESTLPTGFGESEAA